MKKTFLLLIVLLNFTSYSQLESPSVEWKYNDIPDDIPISPMISTTSTNPIFQPGTNQYDSSNEFPTRWTGEDWWYSIANDPNTGGYITAGFATWMYLDFDEIPVGGCKTFIYPIGLDLKRPILSNESLSAKLATVALYDKHGKMVWCKALFQADEGAFNCKVDLSGNIIITGWSSSTRDISGNPITMKFAGGVEYDIASDPVICSLNKAKPFIAKISPTGSLLWTHFYSPFELGHLGMTNSEFFQLSSYGIDLVIADNGNYVLAGQQEFASSGNEKKNTFIIEVDGNGDIVQRAEVKLNGYNVIVNSITKNGTGYLVCGGANDESDIVDLTYNIPRMHGFCMAFDSNLHPYTAGTFGNINKSAIVFDGMNFLTPNVGLIWLENDYNVAYSPPTIFPSLGKVNIVKDAKVLTNNNIVLADIIDCNGCQNSSANRGIGEIRIYSPNGSALLTTKTLNENGDNMVTAFDLKIGLEADDGNEITVITSVNEGDINNSDPVFIQSMDIISNGTDSNKDHFVDNSIYYPRSGPSYPYDVSKTSALISNYDINGNLRWEKIIDINDASIQVYPGDWKEQECVYQVVKDQDGAYVFVGNNSYNKDDYLIAKVYGNCHLDKVYDIAPTNPLVDNTVVLPIGITTWSPSTFGGQTTISVRGEIIVPNGAYLMISGLTVRFADGQQMIRDTRLILEPGGQVKLDNSRLTSMDCPNTMWTGIEVHGNSNQPQFNIHQGSLVLVNSTIENAHNAIRLWEPDNWSSTGGIVRAWNTTFLNNRRDVEFIDYNWSYGGIEHPNRSLFSDCNFITDNNLLLETVNDHVTLYKVFGVRFISCDFADNRIVGISRKSRGIFSIDAKYKVLGRYIAATPSLSEYYDDVSFDPSTFYNLISGVEAMNANSVNTITVDQASFTDCKFGVRLSQVDNAIITRNKFDRTPGVPSEWMGSQFHIYTDKSTAYLIEGNVLESQHTGDYTVGVEIENSGLENNEVFKNKLTQIDFGVLSYGKNRNDAITSGYLGLEFLCNQNTNNYLTDELFLGNDPLDGAKLVQGIPGGKAAGNTFSTPSGSSGQWHLRSNLVEETKYYWYNLAPIEEPTLLNGNVIKIATNDPNDCPTTFNIINPGPGKPIANNFQKTQLQASFDSLKLVNDQLKIALTTLEDNGDRLSLQDQANNVTFWTMYTTWLSLKNEAPYLSENILRILGNKKPWEFSSYFLKDLIIDNIEVTANSDFMSFLETKQYPMSHYYIQQIETAKNNSITPRGLKQAEIMDVSREKNRVANVIIKDIVQDSLGIDPVAYNEWVVKRGDVLCELQLLDNHLARGEKAACATKMAVIDGEIGQLAAGRLKTELQDYRNFKNEMIQLTKANGTLQGLDSISEPIVRYYATNAIGYAQVQAQNLLCFFRGECKDAPDPLVSLAGNKSLVFEQLEENLLETKNSFKIYPNPTRNFVIVEFEDLQAETMLKIIDMNGKVMHEQAVTAREISVDLNHLQKGVYLVFVISEGNLIERDKLIIQ